MREDEEAWRAVGRLPDRHEWLGFPDGEVDRVPLDELTDAVGQILDEEQPTVVETFGPDGIFGHPDHIAIGAATDAAFLRSARSSGTGFRRLLHRALPQTVFERWNAQRRALGLKVFDPTNMYHMRGVPDSQIGLIMDCRSVADRIVAGLQQHKSQHHVMSDDPDDTERWKRVTSRSWAVVAWPQRRPGAPTLTDIFDGLP
jgi:LmbE family N-acetylglucosaminyl deacetylase